MELHSILGSLLILLSGKELGLNCRIRLSITVLLLFHWNILQGDAAQKPTFESDVRPILKAHCFQCHGEGGEKEGSLDLRLKRFMLAGGDSGPAIVPGNAGNSLLLKRIQDREMPPENKNPLEASEIEILKQWILSGATTARAEPESLGDDPTYTKEERSWWAFQPVKRPAVPEVVQADAVQTAVDGFLLNRLEREETNGGEEVSYGFASLARREVFIRRASFDLLGLPPSPEAVAEFQSDRNPDAWSRLIERLLASPHYGERWGRHWLDVAGYADSEGYTEEDRVRPYAWHYRDYVIHSLNENKPFDQFLVEQLAGDELVDPTAPLTSDTIEKLTATGFLRMAPDGTASGGIDQNLARNQVVADTLQIVGTSLLGMTVHCAQCHDHRYDPISQVDYYKLRAIFEPALDWKHWKVSTARQVSLYTDSQKVLRADIESNAKKVDAERQKVVQHYITRTLEQELLLLPPKLREALRTAFHTPLPKRTPEQKELLSGHASIANIREGSLYLYERRRSTRLEKIKNARAKREQELISETRTRELKKLPPEIRAEVSATVELPAEKRTAAQSELLKQYPTVLVNSETVATLNPDAEAELTLYTKAAEEIRTTKIKEHLQEFTDRATEIRAKIPAEDFLRALTETPGKIEPSFVFHRGDHDQPRQRVKPAGLGVLGTEMQIPENDPKLPTSGRRLSYARYLTSGKHPLVARVIVNRVWMHHFGRGLVNSPGDFGVLGERPTHPQLLDWLAAEFMKSGWDLKHLHRVIMQSSAYQQSSIGDPSLRNSDPENRLYGRMSVRRLESESLRDAILLVSGMFNNKLFGQPVPVMEDEVGQIIIGKENLDGERKPTARVSLNGEEYRRSVYVQVRRSRTLAALETFDAPAMTPNCDQRAISNVAPQSLWFMNSKFMVDSCQNFAARLMAEHPDDLKAQIAAGWRLAVGTTPGEQELNRAVTFVGIQQAAFRNSTIKSVAENADQQALASFCQALFSSNRFLYVE